MTGLVGFSRERMGWAGCGEDAGAVNSRNDQESSREEMTEETGVRKAGEGGCWVEEEKLRTMWCSTLHAAEVAAVVPQRRKRTSICVHDGPPQAGLCAHWRGLCASGPSKLHPIVSRALVGMSQASIEAAGILRKPLWHGDSVPGQHPTSA